MLRGLLGIAIVLAASRLSLAAVCAYQQRCAPRPEVARKLLHIAMGLVILSYPWLFDQHWPVLLLTAMFVLLLTAGLINEPLRRLVAPVMYGVQRCSWGEFCFPLSAAALFILSEGEALLFCVPLLIMTVADAAAALIGMQYGQHRYRTLAGHKSLEGSAIFFLAAFFIAEVPLLLWTSTPPRVALLIALALSAAATALEAVACNGLDNILVPLGSFGILKAMLMWWAMCGA